MNQFSFIHLQLMLFTDIVYIKFFSTSMSYAEKFICKNVTFY